MKSVLPIWASVSLAGCIATTPAPQAPRTHAAPTSVQTSAAAPPSVAVPVPAPAAPPRPSTDAYIQFMARAGSSIPVLPWQALLDKAFRTHLLCATLSPVDAVADKIAAVDHRYKTTKYPDAFEKNRAHERMQNEKKSILESSKTLCRNTRAPMFYADVYFPISDASARPGSQNAYVSLREFEIEWGKERHYPNGNGFKQPDKLYLANGTHSIWVHNDSNKSHLWLSIASFEKLYKSAQPYRGQNPKYRGKMELTGRVYFSLSSKFTSDFKRSPDYVFWLYPEYFETSGHAGEVQAFKPWPRNEYAYGKRNTYSLFTQ